MRRSRVEVGAEQGKGSSLLMSRPGPGTRQGNYIVPEPLKTTSLKTVDDKIFDFDFDFEGDVVMKDADMYPPEMSPMPMDRVDQNIFIGDSNGASDISFLRTKEITHIINTAKEIPNFFAQYTKRDGTPEFHYLNLGLQDNSNYGEEDLLKVLEPSYRYIMGVLKKRPSAHIFIHCHMGRSRSASIVLYYLMRSRDWPFERSLDYLKKARWIVSPNPWYTKQLEDVSKHISNQRSN